MMHPYPLRAATHGGVLFLLLVLADPANLLARTQDVVVPNGLEGVEGNANNSFPYNLPFAGVTSQRYHQVYGANQFTALSGPNFVTHMAFRPDDLSGDAFSNTIPNIRVTLSTSSRQPDALSNVFNDNLGPDATVVHDGPLTLSSSASGIPRAFDIVLTLQTPFIYDPAGGNLLMEVRNFSGGPTTSFDAENVAGDGVSRVYTTIGADANSAVANGTLGLSLGLVTRFTFEPVPEPTMIAPLLLCISLLRRQQRCPAQ